VNTNGVISFESQVSSFTPIPFPLDNQPVVAPFWADVDTSLNNGRIYYRQTTAAADLATATGDIRGRFPSHSTFSATWVFVATWYDVTYYGGSPTTGVST
jgi:alpha-tectorin